jgi:hypothetical protein
LSPFHAGGHASAAGQAGGRGSALMVSPKAWKRAVMVGRIAPKSFCQY